MGTLLERAVLRTLRVCIALCLAISAQAQVILCERVLPGPPTNAYYYRAEGLLKIRPDTLRLLGSFSSTASNTSAFKQHMTRVGLSNCDTLSLAGASVPTPNIDIQLEQRPACVTRRSEVLMASTQRTGAIRPGMDSVRLRLTLVGRNGRVRWSRLVAPCLAQHNAEVLLEAPDGGFYAAGSNGLGSLLRLDSLGRLLWCRTYRGVYSFRSPAYSRRGTLLFSVSYTTFRAGSYYAAGLLEVSQRGDSLGLHPVRMAGSNNFINREGFACAVESLRPLRDGGFLFIGSADTITPGRISAPFLARYNSNLQVSWAISLPRQGRNYLHMAQPFELADGTLLVFVHDADGGRGQPFWFYRFSATGTLLQRYAFASSALPLLNGTSGTNYWSEVQGIQPLRDSTFMLAITYDGPTQSNTYLAHLRVPGLPRVLDSSFFPLAARPGAGLLPEALGPPHPHPATETVAFAYALPHGTGAAHLVLTDVFGRTVIDLPLEQATGQATLPVQALAPGLYLATLRTNGQSLAARKLAVTR